MIRNIFSTPLFLILATICLMSCASYRQNIMFKVEDDPALRKRIADAEKNYTIQPNDIISMKVYTNRGERLIDPEFQLRKEGTPMQQQGTQEIDKYFVDEEGVAKLPMVGQIKLVGLTLRQAEEIVQEQFARFYTDPYVKLQFHSKRVIVLGASGGQVIPLEHNNIKLTEVLARATGITNEGKAHNIRVLRGDEVMVADFSTFEGYQKYNVTMQSGDVVYIEPVRRAFVESMRDYAPLLTVVTSMLTLIVVFQGL